MANTIPRIMQPYFFQVYLPNGHLRMNPARKVLEFLSVTGRPELAAIADDLVKKKTYFNHFVMDHLLERFLEEGTIWETKLDEGRSMGYQVRVGETLIEHTGQEVQVFEIDGSRIDNVTHKRTSTGVLEWFDKKHIGELLQAIECRVAAPETMWSGLDNRGNNNEYI